MDKILGELQLRHMNPQHSRPKISLTSLSLEQTQNLLIKLIIYKEMDVIMVIFKRKMNDFHD